MGFRYLLGEVLPHVHNHYVRSALRRRPVELNGVETRYKRIGDDIVPWRAGHSNPESYERGIIHGLRAHASGVDDIVVVGGGWGVSATVAGNVTGSTGNVYESSSEQAELARETAALNDVEDRIEINVGAVDHPLPTYGAEQSDEAISPVTCLSVMSWSWIVRGRDRYRTESDQTAESCDRRNTRRVRFSN